MTYEELIAQLCEVIKESEVNAQLIYDNAESLEQVINDLEIASHKKDKIVSKISDIFGLLQHQDLHRQKIERVVNFVCEKNDIDKTQYNIAPSAKNIDSSAETLSDDELEALIKQMQA
jgi:Glu-tRNA(Gln) amidotransferase subunit E-like FAD-binding protein